MLYKPCAACQLPAGHYLAIDLKEVNNTTDTGDALNANTSIFDTLAVMSCKA